MNTIIQESRIMSGYQNFLKLDPEDTLNRILLAEIYSVSGNEVLAIKEYKEILDLDPDHQRIRLILTTILIRNGQYEPALMHLNTLIQKRRLNQKYLIQKHRDYFFNIQRRILEIKRCFRMIPGSRQRS